MRRSRQGRHADLRTTRPRRARPRRPPAHDRGGHGRDGRCGTRLVASIPLAPWRDGREPFIEFGYEGDEGSGERSIAQVIDGTKTVSVSLAREWDLEGGPPRIGQRVPITDHLGNRRAIVEVTRVAVLPFGQIDSAVVSAESAGSESLERWMTSHRAFYGGCRDEIAVLLGEPGWRLTDAEPMVITSFRLVEAFPAPAGVDP